MQRTLAKDTPEKIGEEVLIKGWVRVRRDHGKLIFLDIRDRSGLLQTVALPSSSEESYKTAQRLNTEDAVEIKGKVNKRPGHTINKDLLTGEIEVEVTEIKLLAKAKTPPFDMGGDTLNLELPTLLDNRSLTIRHPKIAAIFKVQSTIAQAFRESLWKEGFTEVFVPAIVPSATEGGAEVFPIEYYSRKAYLAQSPQFYKQMTVPVYERVFTLAHAYRAEPSITTRHLAEYLSLDCEIGFIDSFQDLMDQAEKTIKYIFDKVKKENEGELKMYNAATPTLAKPIPRIKLREAQEILFKRTSIDHRNEPDLDPSDEKEICKWAQEESGSPFVFITHYPTKKRPFYTMPDKDDPEYTLSFDLIGVNEEWVTGGQRINDYNQLISNIRKWGNDPAKFGMYLQAFEYGMPPEGGFAMGLERITKDILGLSNIREASLFPRDMERVDERFSKTKEK